MSWPATGAIGVALRKEAAPPAAVYVTAREFAPFFTGFLVAGLRVEFQDQLSHPMLSP